MKSKYILMGLALAGVPHMASSNSEIHIKQVPPGSKMTGNSEARIRVEKGAQGTDYQQEILNNPEINEQARTKAVLEENNFNGNVATVVQNGKSNKSNITQSGKKNLAKQVQTGNNNDLHLKQTGDDNHSEESQTGNNNHKVIIQNGNKTEVTETNDDEDSEQ